MRKLTLAMIQPVSTPGLVENNLLVAEKLCIQAAKSGAQIICLPELFNTGYNLQQLTYDTVLLGKQYFTKTIQMFSNLSRKLKTHIICPIVEPIEDTSVAYNVAFIFDDSGQQVGKYRKVHLWKMEKELFKAGDALQVIDTKLGKLGILLCYDIGFPEAARSLCMQDAEIIFVAAAWRIEEKHIWDINLAQRAIENSLFTVGVNTSLTAPEFCLFGNSKVYHPGGHCIYEMQAENDFGIVTIDLDEVTKVRKEYDYLCDLKSHVYTR